VSTVELNHALDGPEDALPLVLGPSLGATIAMWEPNVAALSARHRLLRYDHRGEGASPVPPGPYEIADLGRDVLALLDRLEIERASFGGISLGGMVSMWIAANAPERVDRLVLLCTAAHMPPASAWVERAAAVRAAGSTEPIAGPVVARWLTPEFAREHPGELERLRAMLLAQPADGYAECCGAIERMDLRRDLPLIAAPTLVIAGADDEATPVERAQVIAAGIPGARLEILSPGAHIVSVERADAVNRLILSHLEPEEPS
jgi:3-oxoadipate enol-lactonase